MMNSLMGRWQSGSHFNTIVYSRVLTDSVQLLTYGCLEKLMIPGRPKWLARLYTEHYFRFVFWRERVVENLMLSSASYSGHLVFSFCWNVPRVQSCKLVNEKSVRLLFNNFVWSFYLKSIVLYYYDNLISYM